MKEGIGLGLLGVERIENALHFLLGKLMWAMFVSK